MNKPISIEELNKIKHFYPNLVNQYNGLLKQNKDLQAELNNYKYAKTVMSSIPKMMIIERNK